MTPPTTSVSCISLSVPVTISAATAKKPDDASMTPQDIAKWLDRRSRMAFPITFIFANVLYWSFVWL